MSLYRELIIELYKNPLNKRAIKTADATASGSNPLCGDRVRIYLKIGKKGRIKDASFDGQGCAVSIAAASLLTENAKGKSIEEIEKWNSKNVFEWLGAELSSTRLKCGLLSLETMQIAIQSLSIGNCR